MCLLEMCYCESQYNFSWNFWTLIRLILPKIYSSLQQKTYARNNTWSWQNADTAKTSLNFEKRKFRILILDKFGWNLDELLKIYNVNYTEGWRVGRGGVAWGFTLSGWLVHMKLWIYQCRCENMKISTYKVHMKIST